MRAIVIGATGAVGSSLVRELLASPRVEYVVTLTRRPVDFGPQPKLVSRVIDLADIERETTDAALGCDTAFCTMGVGQPRKLSKEEVRRVDVEYAAAFARGARAGGVRHISLLSSVGANSKASSFYLWLKGEAEAGVVAAGIARTSLFRPSLLVTKEIRYGLQDRLTQALFPPISHLLPARFHPIAVEDLGRAMRINAERDAPDGVEILQYPQFAALLKSISGV
ncbi:MAG: hypothetical protein QOI24_3631 [Acidobacteriota bacterium]|jgi:uncharacterized protein YbjT (DUF2867 family)|nr:hypothetical protein [Acidobacteriota bacterium]